MPCARYSKLDQYVEEAMQAQRSCTIYLAERLAPPSQKTSFYGFGGVKVEGFIISTATSVTPLQDVSHLDVTRLKSTRPNHVIERSLRDNLALILITSFASISPHPTSSNHINDGLHNPKQRLLPRRKSTTVSYDYGAPMANTDSRLLILLCLARLLPDMRSSRIYWF